jgi:hypothetical protein
LIQEVGVRTRRIVPQNNPVISALRFRDPNDLLPPVPLDRIGIIQAKLFSDVKDIKDQLTLDKDAKRHKQFVQLIEESEQLSRLPWPVCDAEDFETSRREYNATLSIPDAFYSGIYKTVARIPQASLSSRLPLRSRYRHSYCIAGLLYPFDCSHTRLSEGLKTCYTGSLRPSLDRKNIESSEAHFRLADEFERYKSHQTRSMERAFPFHDYIEHDLSECQRRFFESADNALAIKAIKAVTAALGLVDVPVVVWGELLEAWVAACSDKQPARLEFFIPVDHIASDEHLLLLVVCCCDLHCT